MATPSETYGRGQIAGHACMKNCPHSKDIQNTLKIQVSTYNYHHLIVNEICNDLKCIYIYVYTSSILNCLWWVGMGEECGVIFFNSKLIAQLKIICTVLICVKLNSLISGCVHIYICIEEIDKQCIPKTVKINLSSKLMKNLFIFKMKCFK